MPRLVRRKFLAGIRFFLSDRLVLSLLLGLFCVPGCSSNSPVATEPISPDELRDVMETRDWRTAEAVVSQLRAEFRPELVIPLLELWEETDRNEVQHRCFRVLNHWGIPVVKNEYLQRLREELHSWNSQVRSFAEESRQDTRWLAQVSRHLRSFGVPLKIMDNLRSRNMRVIRDRVLADVHRAIWVVDQGDVSQSKIALEELHSKLQAEMRLLGGAANGPSQRESEGKLNPGQHITREAAQSPE